MWFWWFILICDLLIPVLMIVLGRIMWKLPPGSINGIIGYRTSRSMKNDKTWKFAQEYCGKLWWKAGWVMLIPSVLLHLPFYRSLANTIGALSAILCIVQCIAMIVPIFFTERALKRNFPY